MLGSMTNSVFFLLGLPLFFSTFSESCSDGTTQRLISGSRYRVQDQFFEADSDAGRHSPDQVRLEEASWCSSHTPSKPPWLQVTFGMDVNISIIQTGGMDNYYVTSFEIHVGDGTEGSFRPVTIPDNSTQPMVFVRTSGHNVENTTLPTPVTAQVLRIVPVEWKPSDASACLRLEALGCLVSPALCVTEGLVTNDVDSIISSPSIPADSPIDFTINDLVTTRDAGWCTAGNLGSNPYFELNFTSLVSLAYMEVQGERGGAYVSQFRLEVQDMSGNFDVYGITSESTIFTASDAGLKLFTFWRPIHGNTFRLHILDFMRNRDRFVCWNVKLYGCITNKNTVATRSTEAPVTPISEAPSHTTQKMNPGSSPSQPIVPILGEVVGGILGLVMLLAIVVASIFIFTRRKSAKVEFSGSSKGNSEHMFNNSIYGKEISLPSVCRDTPEHIFVNSIYGKEPALPIPSNGAPVSTSGEDVRTDYRLANPNPSLSPLPNSYESFVPSTTAATAAPVQHLNGSVASHSEIMHYDPVYAKCSAGEVNTEYQHLTRLDIPSSLLPNTYESVVPSSTAEAVQYLSGTGDANSEMMHYESPYAKCNAVELNTGYHHLARPDIPLSLPSHTPASVPSTSSTTAAIYCEPTCLGYADQHDDNEAMLYNSLYDRSTF